MKKNIGTGDRMFRLLLGIVVFVGSFFVGEPILKIILIAVGIFSCYEALVGWCLVYRLLGRNTCPIE